jgi:prephenate dehydrogenase
MIERIAILGTGLLGTSVGLALRAAGFAGSIAGWNRSPEHARTALAMGAVDSISDHLLQVGRECDVVLIAVPIFATLEIMEQLSGLLGPNQLVTDVGSTKAQIAAAGARLYNQPGRAAFLPGHPMAGKERGGAALADAALFRGAVWIFTDDAQARRSLHSAVLVNGWREWVAAMGAKVVDLDPQRHDELVAWVSHLPQFVSTALSALLEDQVGDAPEIKDVGGRGLREMTRLGASPYSMWRDIAHTNSAQIEMVLHALEQRLAHLRENLKTPTLRDEFEQANRFRQE